MGHKVKGDICPFCKVVTTSSNIAELIKKRIRLNDPDTFMVMGSTCLGGMFGQKQDKKKRLSGCKYSPNNEHSCFARAHVLFI